jgi:NTP pyrophosphatase (non-canonical NTP hydrolase)
MKTETNYNVEGLNELSRQLHEFQVKMGFTDSNKTQRLMLCASEIFEAFEAHRKDKICDRTPEALSNMLLEEKYFKQMFENLVKDTLQDEIADAIIRLLAFCGENNIKIEQHIKAKMRYNELRGFKYGGKKF